MFRNLILLAAVSFSLASCGADVPESLKGPYSPPDNYNRLSQINASPLAQCGAGFSESTRRTLDYSLRQNGMHDSEYFRRAAEAAIFADETIDPSSKPAMYSTYVGCVENAMRQQNSCPGRCRSSESECLANYSADSESCIDKGISGCMRDCTRHYNYSYDQCRDNMCRADDPVNRDYFARRYCPSTHDEGNECRSTYQSCLESCPASE